MIRTSRDLEPHLDNLIDWATRYVYEELVDMWGINSPQEFGEAVLRFIQTDAKEEFFEPAGVEVHCNIADILTDDLMDEIITRAEAIF